MTLTNSDGSITSRISSSSLRNITSLGLWVFGQYFNKAITVCTQGGDTFKKAEDRATVQAGGFSISEYIVSATYRLCEGAILLQELYHAVGQLKRTLHLATWMQRILHKNEEVVTCGWYTLRDLTLCNGSRTFSRKILCSSFKGNANPLIILWRRRWRWGTHWELLIFQKPH